MEYNAVFVMILSVQVSIEGLDLNLCHAGAGAGAYEGDGAMCGEECLMNLFWCNRDTGEEEDCGGFTSNDNNICGNSEVWKNVSCALFDHQK